MVAAPVRLADACRRGSLPSAAASSAPAPVTTTVGRVPCSVTAPFPSSRRVSPSVARRDSRIQVDATEWPLLGKEGLANIFLGLLTSLWGGELREVYSVLAEAVMAKGKAVFVVTDVVFDFRGDRQSASIAQVSPVFVSSGILLGTPGLVCGRFHLGGLVLPYRGYLGHKLVAWGRSLQRLSTCPAVFALHEKRQICR